MASRPGHAKVGDTLLLARSRGVASRSAWAVAAITNPISLSDRPRLERNGAKKGIKGGDDDPEQHEQALDRGVGSDLESMHPRQTNVTRTSASSMVGSTRASPAVSVMIAL